MQKVCPFDINAFTGLLQGHFVLFNTYRNTTLRLITSEVVRKGEENTIVLHGLYFDGYDTKLKFNYDDLLEPSIEMEEHVCGSTAELFDTTHGNGKLMMTQPSGDTRLLQHVREVRVPLRQHPGRQQGRLAGGRGGYSRQHHRMDKRSGSRKD